jgi:hypothetical protein
MMRSNHLPKIEEINVLDAFSADGDIWRAVKRINPDKNIKVARVESRRHRRGFYLRGDNVRFMRNTDLNTYDVIDLDSYGIPYPQIEEVFNQAKRFDHKVVLFLTFNALGLSTLPFKMLYKLGFTRKMCKISSTIVSRYPEEKMFGYLSKKGVKRCYRREYRYKSDYGYYVCFTIGDNDECPIPT